MNKPNAIWLQRAEEILAYRLVWRLLICGLYLQDTLPSLGPTRALDRRNLLFECPSDWGGLLRPRGEILVCNAICEVRVTNIAGNSETPSVTSWGGLCGVSELYGTSCEKNNLLLVYCKTADVRICRNLLFAFLNTWWETFLQFLL